MFVQMKKVNFRSALIALLVITSLSSYLYLQSIEIEESEVQATEIYKSEEEQAAFPEIELVKKVLEISKTIIPAIPSE